MPEKRYTPDGQEVPPPSANDVLYEPDGDIAWITLNRPLVLNAVDWSVLRGLARALDQAEADASVRALVLRGAGRAFCAGGDLQAPPQPEDGITTPSAMDLALRLWTLEKPVIAAVRGHAVGQGCEFAGVCDVTIAADDAQFGEIQIRHGFGPPILITPFLAGLKAAKEIMMLGEIYTAEEARRLGLVNRVVPAERLMPEAEAMARKFASLPATTVALNKRLVNRAAEAAGMLAAMHYREDPLLAALAERTRDDSVAAERLRILREQGWEQFKRTRDREFGGA